MTIRRTLLGAFVAVGVVPVLVLALLAFARSSRALQGEIEQGLAVQAEALRSDVDRLVHERLLNAATWRGLEVMQDLQVGDVDRRLAGFLQRLWQGHGGLYRELAAVDGRQQVVASSDPARLGATDSPGLRWMTLTLAGADVTLDLPRQLPHEHAVGVSLRTPLVSGFGAGVLGELRLRLDWVQIDQLLERAAVDGRRVALLDAEGRLVAGSQALLAERGRLSAGLADWAREQAGAGHWFVGSAAGTAVRAPAWQVLVLVPRDAALAPVHAMAWIFAGLLAAVGLATVAVSGAVSQAIARPVVALTQLARSHRLGQPLPAAPAVVAAAGGEVGELHQAFGQMVRELEQGQQQLARASALAAVGEMSAVIAHEVRTPLGIMLTSAQMLQREPQLSPEGRELAGFLESETTRLSRLVTTMLDSTRPRLPQRSAHDLGALVEHAVALLAGQAAERGVHVSTQVQTQPGQAAVVLDVDAEQMTQVLLNLLKNGLQILARGGRIEVRTVDQGRQVLLEMADDGPGVAPADRQRIFEAFHFQREGGIGLGLAVVQSIVAAHGGQVAASDSELGGALFCITLPRDNPSPEAT